MARSRVATLTSHSAAVLRRERDEIVAAQHHALFLARLTSEKQNDLMQQAHNLLDFMSEASVLQGRDVVACNAFLKKLADQHGWITSLRVATTNGDAICRNADPAAAANIGDREYFRTALAHKRFTLSGYLIGNTTRQPIIVGALPILNSAGDVERMLLVTVNVAALGASVEEAGKEAGAAITIVDAKGVVLARYPASEAPVGKTLPEPALLERVLAQPEGELEFTGRDGTARIFGFAQMRETPERVIVGLPKSDVLRQLDADFRRSLVILALITVVALAATWALAEVFVVRGVRLLTGLAHRIGGGDLGVKPARLNGELGVLATALGEMAEKLKARDEALVEAAAAAEEAVRAKGEFMAAMSHEIRTPLNGIIGFANLLHGTELNERQRQFTSLLKDAGQSLLSIVNDILDFSKIEAGKLELETIEFSLAELVESCLALVRKTASDKGLELSLVVTPDVPRRLEGDPNRLRQVLLNLLNNAVKFTPRGRVLLSVSCLAREALGPVLKFAVADTGIGIPAEKLSLIFEKFSQVDRSVSRQYGGTGLGLAISKRLVELMGGEIGVDSRVGAGSTFWFRIILKEAGAQPVEAAAAAASAGAVVTPLRRPARILLAEDLPTNQMLAA